MSFVCARGEGLFTVALIAQVRLRTGSGEITSVGVVEKTDKSSWWEIR